MSSQKIAALDCSFSHPDARAPRLPLCRHQMPFISSYLKTIFTDRDAGICEESVTACVARSLRAHSKQAVVEGSHRHCPQVHGGTQLQVDRREVFSHRRQYDGQVHVNIEHIEQPNGSVARRHDARTAEHSKRRADASPAVCSAPNRSRSFGGTKIREELR
mmetsp:Transcript_6874/g.20381  ORF Transcript_6874/g.20381 Transcript_6874/m.20381 type:complete len:161 (-) Transcript_6874:208-690(-)